jgi:hypothetical protein
MRSTFRKQNLKKIMDLMSPICRYTFDTRELIETHPAKLHHPNKRIVYDIACPANSVHSGQLVFSRWNAIALSLTFSKSSATDLEVREGYFKYEPFRSEDRQVEWHLNFADRNLFYAYGSALFAQDEMQVAEHPALGSLREALLSQGILPATEEQGRPTPVLVRGVERRCVIATDPNPEQGRPFGLYGNRFSAADPSTIQRATVPIIPPTTTNILAIAAPGYGSGAYTVQDIEYILTTAFTGFSAARLESSFVCADPIVVIHTGFWGCGAFGGDRVLMTLLQLVAAHVAGVNRLIFYAVDAAGTAAVATARRILERNLDAIDASIPVSELVRAIADLKFQWGMSDGN